MKYIKGIIFLTIIALLFSACGGNGEQGEGSGSAYIEVSGSDTEVNLAQNLAEAYMEKNPDVSISVTGGGSGTGIAAIINRQTDIANSSRNMSESEIQQALDNGVEPVGTAFAMDGLAVVVNADNPVEELTMEEVSKIYQAEITNWSEVGGDDQSIDLYGRQSNSGTYVYFRENVIDAEYASRMRNMNGTSQIVEAIRSGSSGIGYVGIGYAVDGGNVRDGLKVVSIAPDADSEAITPVEFENVADGSYPISRPLYQFTNGVPEGTIRDFLEFELSEEGQEIVRQSGYYPVTDEYREQNQILTDTES